MGSVWRSAIRGGSAGSDPPSVLGALASSHMMNQFNGDYIVAEMVKAFISPGEYGQRFGQ